MKIVHNGAGIDNTANAKLWLLQNRTMYVQDLYQIGPAVYTGQPPNNPDAAGNYMPSLPISANPFRVLPNWVSAPVLFQWTDADYPIKSTYLGSTFYPQRMKRNSLKYKIGMEPSSLTFDLFTKDSQQPSSGSGNPGLVQPYSGLPNSGNPITGVRGYPPYEDAFLTYKGVYDGKGGWGIANTLKNAMAMGELDGLPFSVWRAFMPTQGDADTIGIAQIFSGYLSKLEITRSKITVTAASLMQVFQTKVPTQLIEPGDRGWSYIPRTGFDNVFAVLGSSSTPSVIGVTFQIAGPGSGYTNYGGDGSDFNDGWAMYAYDPWQNDVAPWQALRWNAYYVRRIRKMVAGGPGTAYQIYLYEPLPLQPWTISIEKDSIYLWKKTGLANGSSPYGPGFPYVPPPEAAV